MPTIDPGISKEWPLLVLFIIVVGAFLAYLERKDKRYQDALDKRDALIQKVSETLETSLSKQDDRWIAFFADQNVQWRDFIKEAMEQSNAHDDLVAQRLQELGGIINSLVQEFRAHDQRGRRNNG